MDAEEKLSFVSKVIAGESSAQVAHSAGIGAGQLYNWVRNYKIYGYNGLINRQKGRKLKNSTMKNRKSMHPQKLNESEYEE